jgi:hypothetical protein
LGWVNARSSDDDKRKVHAICVALFLVFGHIAMIAGMLDPTLLGNDPSAGQDMPMQHQH